MKGIHIVPSIEEEASGPTYSVVRLCESLEKNSQKVLLLTLGDQNNKHSFHFSYKRSKWFFRLGISSYLFKDLEKIIQDESIDYIHSHGLWMMPNIYAGWAAKKFKIPLIISPRGALSVKAMKTGQLIIKRFFWLFFQRNNLSSASCFHATSEAEYKDIRRLGFEQPVSIIPNGIDFKKITNKNDTPNKTILFLGRLHPIKGIEDLLYSWSNLQNIFPKWSIKIVGPGEIEYLKELKKLVKRLNIKRVKFLGPVYGENKWRLYRSAELFVLPSYSENFGMTVAESLSVGTPVITTKSTPWSGLIESESGFWIEANKESLEICLKEALLDPVKLKQMGINGKIWIEKNYSWDLVSKQMTSVYSWLLNNRAKIPHNIKIN
jgi:glycosyltransferase involved in cell wall biosynthesis